MKHGIHSLTRDQYGAVEALHCSGLKMLDVSAASYKYGEQRETPSMSRGTAAHMAILEPARFVEESVLFAGKVRNGKAWDEFQSANAGKLILNAREMAECERISSAVRGSAMAADVLRGGACEQAIFWSMFGLQFKGLVDHLRTDQIADLKTTKSAAPAEFARQAWSLRLHVQASMYVDGIKAITGMALPYRIVAVEAAYPHIVQVYEVSEELLERGRSDLRRWLSLYHECSASGRWPGYSTGPLVLQLPPWASSGPGDPPPDEDEEFIPFLGDDK